MISCVIPAYNEESTIARTIDRVRSVLSSAVDHYEIIVIDDGSTDSTPSILRRSAADDPRVRHGSFSRNFGKEAAIYAGLSESKGDAVIVMDGDLQHPPEIMSEMIQLWTHSGYEVVEAVKASRGDESKVRDWCASAFYRAIKVASGLELQNSSDFKLLDRVVVQAILDMPENSRFFRGLVHWVGFKRASIAFDVNNCIDRKSRWQPSQLVNFAFDAISAFSGMPLRIVTAFGIAGIFFSLLFSLYVLVRWASGTSLAGFPTVILVQTSIGSIIMLSLGIMGEYLFRMYTELKRRPLFIFRKDESLIDGKSENGELNVQARL